MHPTALQEPKVRRNPDRPLKNLLVTGGAGFIGSNFINYFIKENPGVVIYNFDKLEYCASANNVEESIRNDTDHYKFVRGDICNADHIMYLFQSADIDTVIHFAAASHVDNSFGNSLSFTRNNVQGTHTLLECARVYGKIEKFVHISTDEVYGEVTESMTEKGFLNPTNPYAASKAAAEFIVKAYNFSFGLPIVITRGNNVYGKYQYPEKVIPRFIALMHYNRKLTIQGNGSNTRTFIHTDDVVRAVAAILQKGLIGEVYNIGSRNERSVLQIAEHILHRMKGPEAQIDDNIEFVRDRAFNDTRYDINSSKLHELGWKESVDFEQGLDDTIDWYHKVALPASHWGELRMAIDDELVAHPRPAAHDL